MAKHTPATPPPLKFVIANRYIVTANADGRIPMTAMIYAAVDHADTDTVRASVLVNRANGYPRLVKRVKLLEKRLLDAGLARTSDGLLLIELGEL